jgi:hypothetical protein
MQLEVASKKEWAAMELEKSIQERHLTTVDVLLRIHLVATTAILAMYAAIYLDCQNYASCQFQFNAFYNCVFAFFIVVAFALGGYLLFVARKVRHLRKQIESCRTHTGWTYEVF